jgi:hypothetical protein
MNYQKKPPQVIIDELNNRGIDPFDVDYYAWPETFGSTTGPHKGIGGATMTAFTIEAWVAPEGTLYYCSGKIKFVEGKFEPFNNVFK